MKLQWLAALSAALGAAASAADTITLSGADPSMTFDGHGGLSAGASSRLLRDYAEPQRSQILDYLWKPGFGANLQICKIEIGGDTQSTDGTEPSFRHYREEAPQCGTNRGYEMWLLQEAAARSASVQSYLLSWGIPNWVGNASYFSAENIDYQVGYAKCVRETIGGSHRECQACARGCSFCLCCALDVPRLSFPRAHPSLPPLNVFFTCSALPGGQYPRPANEKKLVSRPARNDLRNRPAQEADAATALAVIF